MARPLPRKAVAAAFIDACEAELRALKPGNVHAFAAGHRMQVRDFKISATVAAPHIANPRLTVGGRIRRAVDATVDAVGFNTNLGIVLLCAPLAAAAQLEGGVLQARVRKILTGLTKTDASETFAGIRRANPAGLGTVKSADVARPPGVTLLEAMALAARRDRIARAYVTDFDDVFRFGLRQLDLARAFGAARDDAITHLHMAYLAAYPDSHIARKHGLTQAREVKAAAQTRLALARPPISSAARNQLLEFDRELKAAGLNPGTTADFVVATLFADLLVAEQGPKRGG